jgi:hypothetical protein
MRTVSRCFAVKTGPPGSARLRGAKGYSTSAGDGCRVGRVHRDQRERAGGRDGGRIMNRGPQTVLSTPRCRYS